MPEGRRPRGVTQRLRSGAMAESARLQPRRNSQEELPHAPKPKARDGGREEQPTPEARGGDERSYPASEVRGHGREEIPHAPSLRPGVTGGKSYPTHLSPRPGAVAGKTNPTSKEPWLHGRRRA